MSFAQDSGYLPNTVSQLMELVRAGVNEQFETDYDSESFLGTNFYKYFYALIQRLQENEIKTSEIVLKLQEYFSVTNEKIVRPNTTHPGIIDYLAAAGYRASTKPPEDADAGKLYVCVDVDDGEDDYDETKLAICTIIKDCAVAGVVSQGDQVETISLPNNQSFDFKYALPNRIPVILKLTLTLSANNSYTIDSDVVVAQRLFDNIDERYKLGLDFEPARYFSVLDAPWAGEIVLEWSDDDGVNWHDEIYSADFDDLFEFAVDDITVVTA